MTIIALALLFAAAAGQAAEPIPQEPNPSQDLYLRVSTHSGPLPLALDLKGELRGIDLSGIQTCTIRADRTYLTISGIKLEERADHPCIASAEPGAPAILAKFERGLVLEEPGNYLLRIMLQPKEGRPIAGMTHEVKVYKAPFSVGIKATTTD